MIYSKSIVICGGDDRQRYMYEVMTQKGLDVSTFSLDGEESCEKLKKYDVVILPVPVTKDGVYLNGPYKIKLDDKVTVSEFAASMGFSDTKCHTNSRRRIAVGYGKYGYYNKQIPLYGFGIWKNRQTTVCNVEKYGCAGYCLCTKPKRFIYGKGMGI